jgi:magnesium-protoporphyrin O-methyltransferase
MFGPAFSRHLVSRYRRRGLDRTASRIADVVAQHGVEGATVLEIGGGIGDLQLELLRRGARHATNLELVDVYDADARRLASEAGMSDRLTRRLVDIAATPGDVEPADVVVLHRVVCCYPDFESLLTAAADRTRDLLVFSHPPRHLGSRAFMTAQNAGFRLAGRSFRTFIHPPAAMVAAAEARGLRTERTLRGPLWQVVALARSAPTRG